MDYLNTITAAQEFLDLHDDLRLAKRAFFNNLLCNRDYPYGLVYPPNINVHWQKECGEYMAYSGETYSREQDNLNYDLEEGAFDFSWCDENGERCYPEPSEKNLLYVGKWCELYSAAATHKQFLNYVEAVTNISGTRLEKLLRGDGSYQLISTAYRHMVTYLKEQKVKVRPYEGFPFTKELPEIRELELAIFRLIAGALEVYLNPQEYVETDPIKPHKDIKKATQATLRKIDYHDFEIEDDFRQHLEALARGQNPDPYHCTIINDSYRRKLLVREVSLLSKKLLDTTSPKKSRFPTSALKALLSMVEDNPPTRRTLGGYQSKYDEISEDDPNQQPHTDNHSSFLRSLGEDWAEFNRHWKLPATD